MNTNRIKPVYHYSDLIRCKVGEYATLFISDRPGFDPECPAFTSTVQSYDKKTGIIETKNTVYIPDK